jgi:hypothetical protein
VTLYGRVNILGEFKMRQCIDKASISFRIAVPVWLDENRFHELLSLFEKYKGVTDEVTFFTSESHSCLSLEIIQSRVAILTDRMAEVRKYGYRTGINHLTTLGFFKENAAQSLKANLGQKAYLDGTVDVGGRCSNDPVMREYIRALYRMITQAKPDYIWLDDDIHSGVCFCEHCLERFAKIAGRYYSREELRRVFSEGSIESKLVIRKQWIEHSRRTLADLLMLVEKTVHGISPKMTLGLMTGDRFQEGYDFDRWAELLAGPGGAEVMWRPGEGFWSDERLGELLGKSHSIGRQVAFLPDNVLKIQSEIENFMYQRLKKAKKTTALEPAVYIAAGATGAAFNVLSPYNQPMDEYEPLVAELQKTRPFYDLLAKTVGRSKPQGVYAGWNKETLAGMNLSQGEWLCGDVRKMAGDQADELFEIGLPAAYEKDHAQVTLLTGEAVRSFSSAEMEKMLGGGIYLDAGALKSLNEMGYGELTGFEVETFYEKDCIEQWTSHPFNGSFAGQLRDGRQSFGWCGWSIPAAALKPKNEKSQVLSRLINYAHEEIASCTSGVFENKLGGRICVAGYFPWIFMEYMWKTSQMKSIFRWLSKETLPAYIGSYHKINLWSRRMAGGGQAMALLNSSLDSAENIELKIRTNAEEIMVYDMNCKSTTIASAGNEGVYQNFILPEISAWHMKLVCENNL